MRMGRYKMLANMLPQSEISIRDAKPPEGVELMDFIRKSELGKFTLYDLQADPAETKDLSETDSQTFDEVRQRMIRLHAEIRSEGPQYRLKR